MKFLGYDNVLCLSAHPDDAEYGMLGTILKYTDTTFHMICFSEGGDFDTTTGGSRLKELSELLSFVTNTKFHNILTTYYKTVEESRESELINVVEKKNIDCNCIMISPSIDSHMEHRKINNVGIALARKKKIAVIEYKTPSTLNNWTPNVYVDVSNEMYTKMTLLELFESQQSNFYFDVQSLRAFHIDYQCQKRGMSAVESFRILGAYL